MIDKGILFWNNSVGVVLRSLIFIVYIFFGLMLVSCTSSGFKIPFFSTDAGEEFEGDEEEYTEDDEDEYAEDDEDSDSDEEYVEEDSDEDDSTYGSESYGNYVDSMPSTPKKTWVPLKKIPRTTWKHDGKWINTVYIARPGDTVSSISSKIYGADKQDELKSINPILKRREPKVGDKIYYNSPMRPMDRSKFLIYYEDINRSPTSHDINSGENIRTVSTKLLGHVDSWKEIWATNEQVESKGVVNQTVTILYWPDSSSVSPSPVADNNMVPETPPTVDEMPLEPSQNMPQEEVVEEANPLEVTDNNMPPPDMPPMDDPIFEEPVAEEPPMEEPPLFEEPPQPIEEPVAATSDTKGVLDFNNWKVKGGLIAFIFLAVALWFARLIRNRRNRPDFDFSQTNVDIDSIEE